MSIPEVTLNDDLQLMQKVAAGDSKSLEILFRNYYQPLCRFALTYVKDESASEDLVQDVFLNIWNKRQTLFITSSVKSYLFTAVRNHALNSLTSKHAKMNGSFEMDYDIADHSSIEQYAYMELEAKYENALGQLPPKCREVFTMSRNDNKSYKEIAMDLGISVKTVENHMGKALKKLREIMLAGILIILSFF